MSAGVVALAVKNCSSDAATYLPTAVGYLPVGVLLCFRCVLVRMGLTSVSQTLGLPKMAAVSIPSERNSWHPKIGFQLGVNMKIFLHYDRTRKCAGFLLSKRRFFHKQYVFLVYLAPL